MRWLPSAEWPWWPAGLMLGLLNMAAFDTAHDYLSTSTTFSRAAGMMGTLVAPAHVITNAYDVPLVVVRGGALIWLDRRGR